MQWDTVQIVIALPDSVMCWYPVDTRGLSHCTAGVRSYLISVQGGGSPDYRCVARRGTIAMRGRGSALTARHAHLCAHYSVDEKSRLQAATEHAGTAQVGQACVTGEWLPTCSEGQTIRGQLASLG
jgi:hypothetical protein